VSLSKGDRAEFDKPDAAALTGPLIRLRGDSTDEAVYGGSMPLPRPGACTSRLLPFGARTDEPWVHSIDSAPGVGVVWELAYGEISWKERARASVGAPREFVDMVDPRSEEMCCRTEKPRSCLLRSQRTGPNCRRDHNHFAGRPPSHTFHTRGS
jgi:hypothetical protein